MNPFVAWEGRPVSRAVVTFIFSEVQRRELEGFAPAPEDGAGPCAAGADVLAAADGLENKAIVAQLVAGANTVGKSTSR